MKKPRASSQESHYQGQFSSGSKLNAAGNIQMNATGHDLVIAGSQLQAGESVILDAHRDIRITTSTDSEQYGTRASQSGWNITDDITTGNHTQLDGAVISSTATADKNRLDTGTLGWRDIEN